MMKSKRCKKCGLSANDVLCPENFILNDEGLCFQCWAEKNQYIPDYRSPLQRYIDTFSRGEEVEPQKDTKEKNKGG
ncbi:MAG: hypothetical protein ACTSSA_11930 [Candidatus Freyarchaeota archaeon]